MPIFSYSAVSKDGKLTRGELSAADVADLEHQLDAKGLLLVSSSAPGAPEVPPSPISAIGQQPGWAAAQTEDQGRDSKTRIGFRAKMMLVVIGLLFAWMGYRIASSFYTPSSSQEPETSVEISKITQWLVPGMTRAELEAKNIVRAPGEQSSAKTRYLLPSGLILEVPFENTGGDWSGQNRIDTKQPPKIWMPPK